MEEAKLHDAAAVEEDVEGKDDAVAGGCSFPASTAALIARL